MVFKISKKTFNDIHLGLCFTVLCSSYHAISNIQQMFLISINHDNPVFNVNGYVLLGIIHACSSLSVFFAPSLITMIGWKPTMLIGAISINYFVLFYFESNWLAYLGAILHGFGESFLWLSQATYMILNSEVKSTTQSVSIFWTLYQASFFMGNAIVYFLFNGNDNLYLNRTMRQEVIIILASIGVCGFIMISLLNDSIRQNQVDKLKLTPVGQMKDVWQTIKSKDTVFNNFMYIFCGFNLCFLSVMGSSMGFTEYLSNNPKKYAPLTGLIQGVGEIVGCIFTAWLKRKSILKLRAIPIACIATMATYVMVFLALPNSAVFSYTDAEPPIELSIYMLMVGTGLIGFGDACLQTEIYNYLGYMHPHTCAPSIAHYKFTKNVASTVYSYYSSCIGLQFQTALLTAFSILAFCAFYGSWNKSYSSENEEELSQKNLGSEIESVSVVE